MPKRPVFVTGASGFLAKHIVLKLLEAGREVRASVRTAAKAEAVRKAVLPHLPPDAASRLSFVTLDLMRDAGWADALSGCVALIHTASPFPIKEPDEPMDVIRPALEGTMRALRAAQQAGVRRVVLTSSTVAVLGADSHAGRPATESDWADTDKPGTGAYTRSKTLAERAAWDFVARAGKGIALTTINPGWILGPPLDEDYGSSISLVRRVLRGRDPMLPELGFVVVDVRDVAEMHVRALDRPQAIGERLLAVSGSLSLPEWGRALKAAYPDRRIPTRTAPRFLLKVLSLFDGEIRAALPLLGQFPEASNQKARELLQMDFIPPKEALLASADWLARHQAI